MSKALAQVQAAGRTCGHQRALVWGQEGSGESWGDLSQLRNPEQRLSPQDRPGATKLTPSFHLSPLQTGRIEPNYPKVCGHQGNVLDIKWNPFIDNIIASCSEDTSVSARGAPQEGS